LCVCVTRVANLIVHGVCVNCTGFDKWTVKGVLLALWYLSKFKLYESWPILRIASVLIWRAPLSFESSL